MASVLESRKAHIQEKKEYLRSIGDYLVNPSYTELIAFCNDLNLYSHKMARITIDQNTGDFYVWDSFQHIHSDINRALGITPHAKYGISVQIHDNIAYFSSDVSNDLSVKLLDIYKKNKNFMNAFRKIKDMIVLNSGGSWNPSISYNDKIPKSYYAKNKSDVDNELRFFMYTKEDNNLDEMVKIDDEDRSKFYLVNPSREEVLALIRSSKYKDVRFGIEKKTGKIYFWKPESYGIHMAFQEATDIPLILIDHYKTQVDYYGEGNTGLCLRFAKNGNDIEIYNDFTKSYKRLLVKEYSKYKSFNRIFNSDDLNESLDGEIEHRNYNIKYWKNPSKSELYFILNTSKYHQARFGIDNQTQDLYVWDGYYLSHYEFGKQAGISMDKTGFYIQRGNREDFQVLGDGFLFRDIDKVKNNKNFQRMVKGSTVFYTDDYREDMQKNKTVLESRKEKAQEINEAIKLKVSNNNIDEQFGGAFDYYGTEVRYWKNPMPQEIQSLVAGGINEFRIVVLQYSPTIYVFDARAATHGDFCSAVGIYMNSIIQGFMSCEQTGEFLIQAYVHEDLAELEKNPNIRRLMSALNAKGQVIESNTVLSVRKKNLTEKIARDFEGSNEILVNPTIKELAAFIIRNINPLRFAVEENTGNIYFWDAWRITHGSFRRQNNLRLILYNIDHVITSLPTDIGGGLSLDYDSGKFIIYSDSYNFQKSGEELYNIYKKYPKFNKLFSNTPFTKYYDEEQELHEQYSGTFDSYGADVKYWKNPTQQELLSALEKFPRVRFLVPKDDPKHGFYIWNAFDAGHHEFAVAMGFADMEGGWLDYKNGNIIIGCDWEIATKIEADKLNANKYWKKSTKGLSVYIGKKKLTEQYGGKFDSFGADTRYWKNPSFSELDRLLNSAQYHEVRVAFDEQDNVYIFDASTSFHYKFHKETGIEASKKHSYSVMIRKTGNKYQVLLEYDPLKHYSPTSIAQKNFMNNPNFMRMIGHTNPEFIEEEKEVLDETKVDVIDIGGNNRPIKVYINPTTSEIKTLADTAFYKELRFVEINNSVYVWDSYYSIHAYIAYHYNKEKGMDYNIHFHYGYIIKKVNGTYKIESSYVKSDKPNYWNRFKQDKDFVFLRENITVLEAPTTNAGSGAIAGLGIGPQGEPGRINVMNYRKMLRRNINDNKKRIANQKDISEKS